MLTVIDSGHGTALSLHVSGGHGPLRVNSATKVAHLNASLPGGIGPAGFVQGGGHLVTAGRASGERRPLAGLYWPPPSPEVRSAAHHSSIRSVAPSAFIRDEFGPEVTSYCKGKPA